MVPFMEAIQQPSYKGSFSTDEIIHISWCNAKSVQYIPLDV